jgi:hypothetical protein
MKKLGRQDEHLFTLHKKQLWYFIAQNSHY